MSQSGQTRYAPGYDLFKLIVAVILTIILILLLLRGRRADSALQTPPTLVPPVSTFTPTVAFTPTFTATLLPTQTLVPTYTSTLEPVPTPTLVLAATSTPLSLLAIATPAENTCPSAVTRIKIGDVVRVIYRLNLRVGPGLRFPIILTNSSNTLLEVIGGPVCTPVDLETGETRAHTWWMVKMENGTIGWSAEGQLLASGYLLEPVQK